MFSAANVRTPRVEIALRAAVLVAAMLATPLYSQSLPSSWRCGAMLSTALTVPDNLALPDNLDEKERETLRSGIRVVENLEARVPGVDVRDAIRDLKKCIKGEAATLAKYYLGRAYQWDEEFKYARKYLLEAINEKDKFHEAIHALGAVASMEKEYEEALLHFQNCLEIVPTFADALLNRAETLLALGRNAEAVKAYEELIVADAENAELWTAWKGLVEASLIDPAWPKTYVCETDYYIVKTGVSQAYADNLGRCLEQIRDLYDHYFPLEIKRVARKYEVIVYRSKGEYHQYGGPQQAGGHYQPVVRRLYLFKYDNFADTLLVLNHEGFHQYLHEYDANMPQWLNEGLGDFFGGALMSPKGSKAKIDGNHWRVDRIKLAMQRNACATAEALMNMTRTEMYGRDAGTNYAQAWAIVYYCIMGGQGKYQSALKKYFNALRKGVNHRDAYLATFGRLDMARFERDWRNFADKLDSGDEIELRRQRMAGDL